MESEYHPKGWGFERWLVNNEKYCGKILHFHKGKKCSWHYHHIKDETFYIAKGAVKVKYSVQDKLEYANEIILTEGDTWHVQPEMRHQIIALMETDLIEFSTTHREEDSIRIIKGD